MGTGNASSFVNMTGGNTGLFARSPYSGVQIVFILVGGVLLSLITVTGNILVMLSIKVNKHLQNVGHYFLFSLACTDLFTGVCSINIYAVYIALGYWPLGELMCDLWLTVDYAIGHASVLNLLLISCDRYFCVTKPMTYPAHRSIKMAGTLIAAAWILSFLLWTPVILFWQHLLRPRPVTFTQCYCQFIYNPWVTFVTAITFFYLPLGIMAYLYWQIVKVSYDSSRRNSKRPSNGSVSDIVSFGQEEGMSITTKQKNEEAAAGKEKEMLEQCSVDFRELQEDQVDFVLEPLNASTSKEPKILRKSSTVSYRNVSMQFLEKWRRRYATSRDKKVTRTILAVMVAFIVTWTPYNVVVLIFTLCNDCISDLLWGTTYWLSYVNSTVNPLCYALCNDTFKITFKHLLLCQYKNIRGQ